MSSSQDDIAAQILAEVKKQVEIRDRLQNFAVGVRDYWRSISPVESGSYAASVQVFKKKLTVDGLPAVRVGATDFKAHWIEFGTGEPGPTSAYAPRAKTVSHFGGDETRARIDAGGESEEEAG